jgi:hypothetical protein
MINWDDIIENGHREVNINRISLWAMWNVLTSTPFELRDDYWALASNEVKRLLNLDK